MQVTYIGDVIVTKLGIIRHMNSNIRKAKSALGFIRYAARQNINLCSLDAIAMGNSTKQTVTWSLSVSSILDTQFTADEQTVSCVKLYASFLINLLKTTIVRERYVDCGSTIS